MKQARNLIAPLLPIPMIRIAACPAGSSAFHRDSNVRGSSAYPPRLSVNADIPARQLGANNGREQMQQTTLRVAAIASNVKFPRSVAFLPQPDVLPSPKIWRGAKDEI